MQKRIAFPVTSREQAENYFADVHAIARDERCPVHIVWIIDVSPFVHWSARGPSVDSSRYRDAVPRLRLAAISYLSSLARELNAVGVPVTYEIRTGLPEFELSALHRQGDLLVIETESECGHFQQDLGREYPQDGDDVLFDERSERSGRQHGPEHADKVWMAELLGANVADEMCWGM